MLYMPSVNSFGLIADEKRETDALTEKIKKIDTKVAMTINRMTLLQSNRKMKITSLFFCCSNATTYVLYHIYIKKSMKMMEFCALLLKMR